MAHHLIIVARNNDTLYEYLIERFKDDHNVDVISDRRSGQDRRAGYSQPNARAAGAKSVTPDHEGILDRRRRPEVDDELRVRSHVIITLAP